MLKVSFIFLIYKYYCWFFNIHLLIDTLYAHMWGFYCKSHKKLFEFLTHAYEITYRNRRLDGVIRPNILLKNHSSRLQILQLIGSLNGNFIISIKDLQSCRLKYYLAKFVKIITCFLIAKKFRWFFQHLFVNWYPLYTHVRFIIANHIIDFFLTHQGYMKLHSLGGYENY